MMRATKFLPVLVTLGGLTAGISPLAGDEAQPAAKTASTRSTAAERQAAVEKALADFAKLGYSPNPPATGPQIKTPRGYMVPYKLQIPGSDVSFEMVPIPGGKTKIGSYVTDRGDQADEGPQFEVEVSPMWVGKYEVTWAEYWRYMSLDSTFRSLSALRTDLADPKKRAELLERYQLDKDFRELGGRLLRAANKADAITAPTTIYDPTIPYQSGEEPVLPAVTMTQYAAKQYTKWLSRLTGQWFRLPSEAEWEYACRAGTTTAYSFGDDPQKLGDYAWFEGNADKKSQPVGQKKPNLWGLYDMHGNVAEWVLDEYKPAAYAEFALQVNSANDAVMWPSVQWPRVVRGGSWLDKPPLLRSAARRGSNDVEWKEQDADNPRSPWWYTEEVTRGVGFRLVRIPEPFTEPQQKKYWEPDVASLRTDLELKLKQGRGNEEAADPGLPTVIQQLEAVLKRREAAERAKQ